MSRRAHGEAKSRAATELGDDVLCALQALGEGVEPFAKYAEFAVYVGALPARFRVAFEQRGEDVTPGAKLVREVRDHRVRGIHHPLPFTAGLSELSG